MASEALNSVVFINLPESFKLPVKDFSVDNTIPLPVQITKEQAHKDDFDTSSLTLEMILAGILTILAYDTNNQHIDYYRYLLKSARPEIQTELMEAAILKARNEDFDIAEEIFASLRGLDPENMITILNSALFFDERASSYRRSGLHEDADAYDAEAEKYYKICLCVEDPFPDAYFNAGFFYLKQKNFSLCKEYFESFLILTESIDEKNIDENVRYKRQRAKEIINDIKSRNLEDDLFKSAYESIQNNNEEKALDEIKAFIKKNPKVWNAWFMLGWALRRLEQWHDASKAFEQAIILGGNNSDTYNELAICLLEMGNLAECEQKLFEALKIEPENTKIMSNLGILYLKKGDTKKAKTFFETVLAFDKNDELAKKALENL
ncbi:MAG: tetratricopeptide repeat protein [Treponema sp.]|nr:tetratricopeptide repeat protein [Treponema sp.]